MKHPSTRGFFAYWDQMRGLAAAPERSALEPDPVRHLLGDSFVLAYEPARGHPFRVTGTRVCALLGGDMKGQSFLPLWNDASLAEIEDILAIAADEVIDNSGSRESLQREVARLDRHYRDLARATVTRVTLQEEPPFGAK